MTTKPEIQRVVKRSHVISCALAETKAPAQVMVGIRLRPGPYAKLKVKISIDAEGLSDSASRVLSWLMSAEFQLEYNAEAFRFLVKPDGVADESVNLEDRRRRCLGLYGAIVQPLGPAEFVYDAWRQRKNAYLRWSLRLPIQKKQEIYRHFDLTLSNEEAVAAAEAFDRWIEEIDAYHAEEIDRLALTENQQEEASAALSTLVGQRITHVRTGGSSVTLWFGTPPTKKPTCAEDLPPRIVISCDAVLETGDGVSHPLREERKRLRSSKLVSITVGSNGELCILQENGQTIRVEPVKRLPRTGDQWQFCTWKRGLWLNAAYLFWV